MRQFTAPLRGIEPGESQNSPEEQLLHEIVGRTPPALAKIEGIAIGSLDSIAADGIAMVSIPLLSMRGVPARSTIVLSSVKIGQALALAFEGGDAGKPIVMGALLTPVEAVPPGVPEPTSVLIDGERLVFTAEREIELRCGEAAIVLSADGRIQLRGTYITSHASATQRILGGAVNIN